MAVALLLCAVFGLVQAATPRPTKLTAEVGPGFTITLKKGNNRVVSLKKGPYEVTPSTIVPVVIIFTWLAQGLTAARPSPAL